MKNNKGITLIALVITIIVLLILAGVSIAMLTGQNGILSQATQAKDDTAKAEVVERINMELQAVYSQALTGTTDFSNELTKINANLNSKATATWDASTKTLTITGAEPYSTITGNVVANGASATIQLAK